MGEHAPEAGGEGIPDGEAFGGFFDDGSIIISLATSQDQGNGIGRERYRSITVMTGQVSAPAVIALAMSTPRRMPSLSVFHFVDEAEAEAFDGRSAMAEPGIGTGPSGVRAFRGIICCEPATGR